MTEKPEKFLKSDAELRIRLTPTEYAVTQQCATEPPFTGKYVYHKEAGTYCCVACEQPLFSSDTKYDSGSGWPSFWDVLQGGNVKLQRDSSHGMERVEVLCNRCDAHLGHLFDDGPRDTTGQRYCINSASLTFQKKA